MQPVPLPRKRGRLMKDGHVVTKNVIDIPSSDDEQGEPLSQKKNDSNDADIKTKPKEVY